MWDRFIFDFFVVQPYIFDFTANAKGRWLGKKLIDVLSKEFGGYDLDYWTRAIVCGNIKINNKTTTKDYVIKNGDRLLHRTHRHEPSVVGKISLVGETDDILAVSKPASMPSMTSIALYLYIDIFCCSASLWSLQAQYPHFHLGE